MESINLLAAHFAHIKHSEYILNVFIREKFEQNILRFVFALFFFLLEVKYLTSLYLNRG